MKAYLQPKDIYLQARDTEDFAVRYGRMRGKPGHTPRAHFFRSEYAVTIFFRNFANMLK